MEKELNPRLLVIELSDTETNVIPVSHIVTSYRNRERFQNAIDDYNTELQPMLDEEKEIAKIYAEGSDERKAAQLAINARVAEFSKRHLFSQFRLIVNTKQLSTEQKAVLQSDAALECADIKTMKDLIADFRERATI